MSGSTDADTRRLIERLVRETLERLLRGEAEPAPPKPLLVLLLGGRSHQPEALALVRALAAETPTQLLIPSCYNERFDPREVEALELPLPPLFAPGLLAARKLLEDAAGLVVLLPRLSTFAKAARGLADGVPSLLLTESLANGLPTFAAGGDYVFADWPASMPPAMRRGENSLGALAQRDLDVLSSWGLEYRPHPAELFGLATRRLGTGAPSLEETQTQQHHPSTTLKPSSGFVTAEDVVAAFQQGKRQLVLGRGVRITDAALEEAASRSVTILRTD
ncbi:MAG: hypothetical protein SF028_07800 [Candidatus Sumerlaeia bacterium]|nr:hypothetical protein [Candidatus Sumerlaeia bacterium]